MRVAEGLRGIPLTVRAPLVVAALMIAVGTVASERVLSKLAETQQTQLRDLAALYLDGLSVAVLPAAMRQDVWETYDALDRATRGDRSLRPLVTTVIGEDGLVLASSDPLRLPTGSVSGAALLAAPELDGLVLDGATPAVLVRAPLTYQRYTVGQLVAELDVSGLLAQREEARRWLLIGNTAATLVLAGAGYLLVRRMLRPVGLLAERMVGDPSGPSLVPESALPDARTEFGRLLRSYNALVAAERERREAAERLARQERLVSLGRLASSVAHEINNPLGGLLNALDTLKRHGDRPGVAESSIALIERGLLGIRDVVRAMLETWRPERSLGPLSTDDLEDLRLLVAPEIRRRRQALEWDAALPDAALSAIPSGPVRQAALNLLLNASAAAGEGGRVSFRAGVSDGLLRIAVRDGGPGVPPEVMTFLETGTSAAGSGAGLRIVREKMAALGGRITAERCGGATCVCLTIPLAAEVA